MRGGIIVITGLLLHAAPPAHAQVIEIAADGSVIDVTRHEWRPPAPAAAPRDSAPLRTSHRSEIEAAASRHGLSSALVDAVAWTESRYRSDATSRTGAMGVMQLMPATARALGVTDPYDVAQNVDAGAAYLRAQLDRFGNDVERALAAYNAGPGAVRRHGGVPPYRETQAYVRTIMERLADSALAQPQP